MLYQPYLKQKSKDSLSGLEKDTVRFNKLPKDFQKAIHLFDYDNALVHIHQKYKLHIDQSAAIERAVMDIVFGDIHSEEIIPIIIRNLHTDSKTAASMALDISNTVLSPIRELVKKVQDEELESQRPAEQKETLREVM
jgi:hypothetical protein